MCRITGRMDARYRAMEPTGCWPGNRPVSWQGAVLERGNRLTFVLRNNPCSSSSKFSDTSKLSKARPSPKQMNAPSSWPAQASSRSQCLLGSDEDSEERLFVFRIFENSNRTVRVGPKPLISTYQQVAHFEGGWRAICKTRFCMRIAFNNLNESGDQTAAIVTARMNCPWL
jgi:hypothetical protein